MKGEADKHAAYIDEKYGIGTAKGLRKTEWVLRHYTKYEYLKMIADYKVDAKDEAKLRGIKL